MIANETTVISLDIVMCNSNSLNGDGNSDVNSIEPKDEDNKRMDLNLDHLSQSTTICVLNLTERNYRVRILIEKSPLSVIYVPSPHLPHLIVRDGRLSIDPQLDINNHSLTHTLSSQYLRVESSYRTNLTLKFILWKSASVVNQQHYHPHIQAFLTLTPIHYTSLAMIAMISLSLVILIFIALVSHQRKRMVRIVTPSEGGRTSVSFLERSSLSQFELEENDSLEMDYYDYHNSIAPKLNLDSQSNNDNKSATSNSQSGDLNEEEEKIEEEKSTNNENNI
jgi:hypothetical protein